MIDNKKILAIIPARGGSKRLPNKNIKLLAGKPLIGWTIEAAKESAFIDDVFVSTDSSEIEAVVKQYDLSCPELRPASLAEDTTTTNDVIKYVVELLERQGKSYDYFILLQPTSPLRNAQEIDCAIEKLYRNNKKTLVSLSVCDHSPLLTNTLPEDENLDGFLKLERNTRSQDMPCYYRINGAIYIFTREFVGRLSDIYCEDGIAYLSERGNDVDIDTLDDFEYAEYLMLRKKTNKKND